MDQFQMLTNLIENFGFPIVVTAYLLLRFEKRIEMLTEVISELKNTCSCIVSENQRRP
ncbi:YvrJ family protein [Geobacillus stearothermophilus]|uniref:YvrJ family protein n=1 Tax=Geobacillus stearothermophilus TaxID=1422 RepID=UPI002E1C6B4F|nr:YvrJ family protein [Geobacillus stearothermophilus]MED4959814.1 YvrJ family protein [Geobacillus stearothermophilus]